MTALIDYGAGNIFSVKNALEYLGCPCELTSDPQTVKNADRIILPGVGAFPKAMKMLEDSGLADIVRTEAGKKPFLGICLGMQMMFEKSYEFEECDGLGLIKGSVKLMETGELSLPHIGWNSLEFNVKAPLMDGIDDGSYVYFVHSYAAVCDAENVIAYCDYAGKRTAAVWDGKYAYGCQFHPEKSGDIGLRILKNFEELR